MTYRRVALNPSPSVWLIVPGVIDHCLLISLSINRGSAGGVGYQRLKRLRLGIELIGDPEAPVEVDGPVEAGGGWGSLGRSCRLSGTWLESDPSSR